eukprot:CAMPEP_0115008674 /NCGR_PEP_ID=MMETSP0216-20121206/22087_1 /TAXON_ID=223996 /ORGANISM="Protocruzia adherens, Strain Boccale" /LENGTH=322 /DNA_ID=CAMNT_0002376195 /DNA_START=314 /DNA_END=1279 /DNA_ORIENTATION=+
MINSIINAYLKVNWESNIRYFVGPSPTLHVDQAKSQTQSVQSYSLIPSTKFKRGLTLIDTPGFDDTDGLERDDKIETEIASYLQNVILRIDMVAIVIPASQPRLTEAQKYVLGRVTNLCGRAMKESLALIFTYSDTGIPTSLEAIKQFGVLPRHYFQFNNCAVYESQQTTRGKPSGSLLSHYWKYNQIGLTNWFEVLQRDYQPQLLGTTLKKSYSQNSIESEMETLRDHISTYFDINKNITKIESLSKQHRGQPEKIKLNSMALWCMRCSKICAQNVVKPQISPFDSGYCSRCPRTCSKENHNFLPEYADIPKGLIRPDSTW